MAVFPPVNLANNLHFLPPNPRKLLRLSSCGSEESLDSLTRVPEGNNMIPPDIGVSKVIMGEPHSSHSLNSLFMNRKSMSSPKITGTLSVIGSRFNRPCFAGTSKTVGQNSMKFDHKFVPGPPKRPVNTSSKSNPPQLNLEQKFNNRPIKEEPSNSRLTYAEVAKINANISTEIGSLEEKPTEEIRSTKNGCKSVSNCVSESSRKDCSSMKQPKVTSSRRPLRNCSWGRWRSKYYNKVQSDQYDQAEKRNPNCKYKENRSLPKDWRAHCAYREITTGKNSDNSKCSPTVKQSNRIPTIVEENNKLNHNLSDGCGSGPTYKSVVRPGSVTDSCIPLNSDSSAAICIVKSVNDCSVSEASTDSLTSVTSCSSFDPMHELRQRTFSDCSCSSFDAIKEAYRRRSTSECSIDSEDSFVIFDDSLCSSEDGVFIYGTCSLLDSDVSEAWSEHETSDGEDEIDFCESVALEICLGLDSNLFGEECFDYYAHSPADNKDLEEVNQRWQREANDVKEKTDSQKKVRFADDKHLATVHRMIAWDFAYRAARCGPWEMYARDRGRFKARIEKTEAVLAPYLTETHRQKVWQRLNSTSSNEKLESAKASSLGKVRPVITQIDAGCISS